MVKKEYIQTEKGEMIEIERKDHAEYTFATALLDDLILKDWSDKMYDKLKDTYLQGKVSHETWKMYVKENGKQEDANEEYNKEIKYQYLSLISGKEKKWAEATELLRDYILNKVKIFTTKDDQKSEMWVYKDGVYIPQGKSEVKQILRSLLEEYYSQFVFNKVIEKIEPDTFIDADIFFSHNYINEVPVLNGILDVNTLKLKPFDSSKIFFNKLPVKYDKNSICPKIEEFLKSVLSNEEDINVFYEILGFGLLKEYRYENAFMFVGGGRNGKGKTLELIRRLIGSDNCSSVPLCSLIPDSFSISELFGKKFNIAGDIGNQDLKDSSVFKGLTGRDTINGKRKFQRDIHFQNYAKLIFACNDLPMVYDLSRAFWDRWILLEFPYTFVTQEEFNASDDKTNIKIRDPSIIDKITNEDEMSGLLNQALDGLHRLFNNSKFSSTKGAEEVKSTWIRKSNSFIAFCYDNIDESSDEFISKKELRKKYSDYCKEHHVISKSDVVIKKVMQDLFGGLETRKDLGFGGYEFVWEGVKWKN